MKKEEFENLKKKERILRDAAKILKVNEEDLPKVVKRFISEIEKMERRLNLR